MGCYSVFVVAPIVCAKFRGFVFWSLLCYAVLRAFSSVCKHLDWEERAGYFTFIVFLMPCGCFCSLPLPRGAVGLSAVCYCEIS